MVKYGSSHHYSQNDSEGSEVIKAKASNLTVKFKNLVEVVAAVREMTVKRAMAYLKNVLARKECVPFKRFKSGIGKRAQSKPFKTVTGRWPENATRCVIDVLKNAMANCEFYGKDPDDFRIVHIQANQAPILIRRTYRAHGRINAYNRHTSHVQVILKEIVPKK